MLTHMYIITLVNRKIAKYFVLFMYSSNIILICQTMGLGLHYVWLTYDLSNSMFILYIYQLVYYIQNNLYLMCSNVIITIIIKVMFIFSYKKKIQYV